MIRQHGVVSWNIKKRHRKHSCPGWRLGGSNPDRTCLSLQSVGIEDLRPPGALDAQRAPLQT